MKPLLPSLLLAASLVPGTQAAQYNQFQSEQSTVQFHYQQMGVDMDGRFKQFNAQVAFDPANPAAAQAKLEVDLSSIDLGSAEADEEVAGKDWFNTKAFAQASFVASQVKMISANQLEISGMLSIKGHQRELVVPATFSTEGTNALFEGQFSINRSDFGIGEGIWAKDDVVANPVNIKFRITTTSH